MTLPFRLNVLHRLTEMLKEITPANGYASDLADYDYGDGAMIARVYRGRSWFGDNDPIPLISVLEYPDAAEPLSEPPQETPSSEIDWKLAVQGWVTDDKENPTDPAYILLADVRRRLSQERTKKFGNQPDPLGMGLGRALPNTVIKISVGTGVVRPADEISAKAYFWLGVTLRISENAETPYS